MSSQAQPTLWWVRRDFRLGDNPALRAAIDAGSAVLPLFVLDPPMLERAGPVRTAWLHASIAALDAHLRDSGGPGLSVVRGRPAEMIPAVARSVDAHQVHISADFGPYGSRRDRAVGTRLDAAGIELVATGSPYAVAPGTLQNQSGQPFQVFSPFHRAWRSHGVHDPAPSVQLDRVDWLEATEQVTIDADPDLVDRAGEGPARKHWNAWLDRAPNGVDDYPASHDFPGRNGTSHLSVALRWGHLHPRTVLADLRARGTAGAEALARQIAWRDFFADVLFHRPDAVNQPIRPEYAKMPTDEPDETRRAAQHLDAWQQGRTGYPLVDAGMRQMLAEGWMHNRVRMIVASFLIKDLHIGWWHGADWFMERLRDGDIAQNQLNWQWVAGCGTDAAPFFRVFNPTGQASKFDGDGSYIRRYIPELATLDLAYLHEPWTAPGGPPNGYPQPIVDHAAERKEALARYELVRS